MTVVPLAGTVTACKISAEERDRIRPVSGPTLIQSSFAEDRWTKENETAERENKDVKRV